MFRATLKLKSVCTDKIGSSFKGAMPNSQFVPIVQSALEPKGFGKNSLLATSLCCDEVNRTLEKDLSGMFGPNFSMGGLAGFPFGGVTSFGAMAHHIPAGGSCLIVFGPHVGVDADGTVGKVNRRGREAPGACCGSAAAAAGYVAEAFAAKQTSIAPPASHHDAQQGFVNTLLLPYAERLDDATEPDVELPFSLYDAQKQFMDEIVSKACGEVAAPGQIGLLGGIQINTPEDEEDYFLPITFEIRDNTNKLVKAL
jgi:hypothetical protein